MLLAGWTLIGCESTTEPEYLSRLAVKSLVAAPENKVSQELDKVLALGRYTLPDIEQEFHGASTEGQLRLLDVLRRLNLSESESFLKHVARWGTDPNVQQQARFILQRFRRARK